MIKLSAVQRTQDSYGNGEYQSPRGNHKHRGIDFAPQVHAVSAGEVTKLGYPYADDLSFRYVQVTDSDGFNARYFYVKPCVEVGDKVSAGQVLGLMQDLGKRYPNITPHYHFEVKDKNGVIVNPHNYLESL